MTVSTAPAPELDPLYSLAELADYIGVSVQTLYDLRHHGGGPRGFKIGRVLRFRASEVQAWLAAMEEGDATRAHRGDPR